MTLSDAVRLFHIDALYLSGSDASWISTWLAGLARGLYRMIAQRMTGYADAQARQIPAISSICLRCSRQRQAK